MVLERRVCVEGHEWSCRVGSGRRCPLCGSEPVGPTVTDSSLDGWVAIHRHGRDGRPCACDVCDLEAWVADQPVDREVAA